MSIRPITLALLILCLGCSGLRSTNSHQSRTIYVHSHRPDPHSYLYKKKASDIRWDTLRTEISGLTYTPGFIHELRITENKDSEGRIIFQLEELVDVRMDSTLRIHDLWALKEIPGQVITPSSSGRVYIEVNTVQGKIRGQAPCNTIVADILSLDGSTIQFSEILRTKKSCAAIEMENEIIQRIQSTRSYTHERLSLTFQDSTGADLLRFKKID